ncbi:MAG: tetratricopeptide repeat protein [Clostridiales bacterium]|nr:tetratricopeptide repeat protein [Clostridiales bacterium]MCF8021615.1 tetratricopeptide repeat protein [Clostridiales bacterium]
MGFIKRLLGIDEQSLKTNSTTNKGLNQNKEYEIASNNFLRIKKIDFYGEFSKSLNGKYIIAWSDFDKKNGRGGFRNSGNGPFLLLEKGKIRYQSEVQRPNDGKVSNIGTFIFNDWLFGNKLSGKFYAFDKDGNVLIEHLFKANLFNNGISEDGQFAVCQTANASNKDGSKLFLFDLKRQTLISTFDPISGRANDYDFDTDNEEVLYLVYADNYKYRYSFTGEFLDYDNWNNEKIERVISGYDLFYIAEEKFNNLNSNSTSKDYDEILDIFNQSLTYQITKNTEALAYRRIGEIYNLNNDIENAINNLEKAIELNPKVGAKRLLQKLKQDKN